MKKRNQEQTPPNTQTTDEGSAIKKGTYVVVATSSRPWTVAAGIYDGEDANGRIYLRDARQIIYWDRPSKGLFGVAANGIVNGQGRVTPRVDFARYRNEETILVATDGARKSIESEPWT